MAKLTKEEFEEKYGDIPVKFYSYYKYTFTYSGTLPDGSRLLLSYGGNSDDIYRHSVSVGEVTTMKRLWACSGSVYTGDVEGDNFYDY